MNDGLVIATRKRVRFESTTTHHRPPYDPRVETPEHSFDRAQPDAHIPRRVVKGGSFLCSPDYCLRYRPAARQGQAFETSSNHIGFRCVARPPA